MEQKEENDCLEVIQVIERFLLLFQRSVQYWTCISQILSQVFLVGLVVDWKIKEMAVRLCHRLSSQCVMGL